MAGQIAHEINNPLTVILGNSQIMKRNLQEDNNEDNELLLKSIQKIESMVDRITKLIKMMKTLSKQNNILPQSKSKVSDLVSSIISTLNDQFKTHEILITQNNNNNDNVEILCHPAEISQVFLNLLVNSIDSIVLGKKSGERKIDINLTKKSNKILISIVDNGDGIKQDIQDRIFEPFFHYKTSRKRNWTWTQYFKKNNRTTSRHNYF